MARNNSLVFLKQKNDVSKATALFNPIESNELKVKDESRKTAASALRAEISPSIGRKGYQLYQAVRLSKLMMLSNLNQNLIYRTRVLKLPSGSLHTHHTAANGPMVGVWEPIFSSEGQMKFSGDILFRFWQVITHLSSIFSSVGSQAESSTRTNNFFLFPKFMT